MSDEQKPKPPVCYILVRADLPVEVQMVNVGHAGGECVRVAPIDKRTVLRLLHVKDEAELLLYAGTLRDKNFEFDIVYEPDAPYNGAAMALGTTPIVERQSALAKVMYHLPRLKVTP